MRTLSLIFTILALFLLSSSFFCAMLDLHDEALTLCLGVVPMALIAMLSDAHAPEEV